MTTLPLLKLVPRTSSWMAGSRVISALRRRKLDLTAARETGVAQSHENGCNQGSSQEPWTYRCKLESSHFVKTFWPTVDFSGGRALAFVRPHAVGRAACRGPVDLWTRVLIKTHYKTPLYKTPFNGAPIIKHHLMVRHYIKHHLMVRPS